jgi:hypothetical protein
MNSLEKTLETLFRRTFYENVLRFSEKYFINLSKRKIYFFFLLLFRRTFMETI